MIGHRCKNCMWWDAEHPLVQKIPIALEKNQPGFCRKHKPGAYRSGEFYYGVQPIMDAAEFCGEFRGE